MYHINLLDRYRFGPQTRTMRVEIPRRPQWPVTILLTITFCVVIVHGGRASAQTPAFTAPQTRLTSSPMIEWRMPSGLHSFLHCAEVLLGRWTVRRWLKTQS